jgi:hypothetical protein
MRLKSFLSFVCTILVLRFVDLFLTFRYTPDLKGEWNPLVSRFGISWSGFIIVQLSIVLLISIFMVFYFNRKPVKIDQPGLSYNDFIYVYFFGKLRPWPNRILSFPTNFSRHLIFNGFIFMFITIFISLFAITNNLLLITHNYAYISFLINNYKLYFPSCFIVITIASVYVFFTIEYLSYRKSNKMQDYNLNSKTTKS